MNSVKCKCEKGRRLTETSCAPVSAPVKDAGEYEYIRRLAENGTNETKNSPCGKEFDEAGFKCTVGTGRRRRALAETPTTLQEEMIIAVAVRLPVTSLIPSWSVPDIAERTPISKMSEKKLLDTQTEAFSQTMDGSKATDYTWDEASVMYVKKKTRRSLGEMRELAGTTYTSEVRYMFRKSTNGDVPPAATKIMVQVQQEVKATPTDLANRIKGDIAKVVKAINDNDQLGGPVPNDHLIMGSDDAEAQLDPGEVTAAKKNTVEAGDKLKDAKFTVEVKEFTSIESSTSGSVSRYSFGALSAFSALLWGLC